MTETINLTTTDQNLSARIENLGWDDLVNLKRRLSGRVKELSEKIIDIERNRFRSINNNIHVEKNNLNNFLERTKQIRYEVQSKNSQLLSISEKISQSKDFLSMMESRVSSDAEGHFFQSLDMLQKALDEKRYKSPREKNEILSSIKETQMKIEALKAVRVIKDQMREYDKESKNLRNSLKLLDEEHRLLQQKISKVNNIIDHLFDLKRQLTAEREIYLKEYNEDLLQLEKINGRLDYMASMRKRQREEYDNALQKDTLYKIKE
jgi:chromosome segregation ATPase